MVNWNKETLTAEAISCKQLKSNVSVKSVGKLQMADLVGKFVDYDS